MATRAEIKKKLAKVEDELGTLMLEHEALEYDIRRLFNKQKRLEKQLLRKKSCSMCKDGEKTASGIHWKKESTGLDYEWFPYKCQQNPAAWEKYKRYQ
jgi:hypothetical protein